MKGNYYSLTEFNLKILTMPKHCMLFRRYSIPAGVAGNVQLFNKHSMTFDTVQGNVFL